MKEYLKHLWKKKITLIIILIASFFLGYTVSSLINTYGSEYQINFTYENEDNVSFDNMLTKDYLIKVRDTCNGKNNYYDSIDISSLAKNGIKVINLGNGNYSINTKSSYYPDFFLKSTKSISTRAKTYIKTMISSYASDNGYTYDAKNTTFSKKSPLTQGWVYGISALTLLGITSIYLITSYFLYKKNKDIENIPYDNKNIFRTPFHKEYWKDVFCVFKSTKNLTIMAMMLALMMLCKFFSLPSGFGNLGISLTYIVFALASMILGPFAGFILGTLSDILGYFIFQSSYTFFIGYTLQAALCGMIYGLLFYKTKISFTRCLIARILVNLIMNVVVGSLCFGIITNYTIQEMYSYAVIFELPKNLVYLVPQSLVLFFIQRALSPALVKLNLIHENQIIHLKKEESITE